jgi:hypothetical protein
VAWEGDEATFSTPGPLVRVFTAWDPASLPVIESLLEANGIPFEVANEVTQDFFAWGRLLAGHNPACGPPVVHVPAERADEARELISTVGGTPVPEDIGPWE